MLFCKRIDSLDLNYYFAIAEEIRDVCFLNGFTFVKHSQFFFGIKRDFPIRELPFQTLLLDLFAKSVAHFTIHLVNGATYCKTFFLINQLWVIHALYFLIDVKFCTEEKNTNLGATRDHEPRELAGRRCRRNGASSF